MMKLAPDGMTELLAFRLEVGTVFLVRLDLDRLLGDDGQAESRDAGDLLRIVREHTDRGQTEVGEDLRADAVLSRVGRKPELEVRLDGVEPGLLQLVGQELVEETDPATLLGEVEQDTAALDLDPFNMAAADLELSASEVAALSGLAA